MNCDYTNLKVTLKEMEKFEKLGKKSHRNKL